VFRGGDPARLKEVQQRFLAAYDAEQAAGRQEYQDHRVILDRFRNEARTASGGTTP
jgi:hypothetical protein